MLGKKLKLEVGDDACDPKQARSVGEKFAGMKLPFVAGHYCSSSSIPASEAYAEGGVLQITPASTNPTFTERKLWNTFRVCGRDDQQGAVAGAYIAKNFKGKNIAILHDKTTYGKGLADETKKALNKAGMKEKMYEAYNKGDKDFTALVSKMKRQQHRRGLCRRLHTEAGLILRQMRDQGMKTAADGGRRARRQGVRLDHRPGRRRHAVHLRPRSAQASRPPTAIVKKFKAKNIDPEGYTLYTYAAIQVWAQAAAKAKHHRRQEGRRPRSRPASGTPCSARSPTTRRATSRRSTTWSTSGSKTATTPSCRRQARLVSVRSTDVTISPPRQRGGLFLCRQPIVPSAGNVSSSQKLAVRDRAGEEGDAGEHQQPAHRLLDAAAGGARKRARNAANGSTANAASTNGMPSPSE